MARQESCSPAGNSMSSYRVEAIVNVDERGQMVLPKDVRERAGVRAGDKLALISIEKEGQICCISLIKAEDFAEMVKGLLGPLLKELVESEPER